MVLAEPAIRVLMLIEHAIRHDASEMLKAITVAQTANGDADEVRKLKATLERQQDDILDEVGTENDYSAIKKLKTIMDNAED